MATLRYATLPVFALVLNGCGNPFAGSGTGHGAPKTMPRDDTPIVTPLQPLDPITTTPLPPIAADHVTAAINAALGSDPDLSTDLGSERFDEWRRARADQCLALKETPEPGNDVETELADIRHALLQAPLGQRLISSLINSDTTLCAPEAGDGEDFFDRPDDSALAFALSHLEAVVMNRALDRGRGIFVAAHEFRHSWQGLHVPGLASATLAQPQDITASYIKEADANAFALALAWQLRQQGDHSAWQAARVSSNYGQTAKVFEDAVRAHHRANPHDGLTSDPAIRAGMGAAFREWFEKDRLLSYYGDRAIEFRQRFVHGWNGDERIPRNIADRLGQLPGSGSAPGISYLEAADIVLPDVLAGQFHRSNRTSVSQVSSASVTPSDGQQSRPAPGPQ